MRIMAVMAHPDDAEIWCGGTLILRAEKGDTVRICNLSYTGDSIRGREAHESAKRMGCEVESLGLEDTSIRDTDQAAEKLKKSIESFLPDTIITHWYDDMHPDHEATFRVLRRALIRTVMYETIYQIKNFPRVFCCDTYHSLGLHGPFLPDRLIDVTDIWEKKIAAIESHKSQSLEFFIDIIERQCLVHGKSAKTKFAEGFLYLPLFGRTDDGVPLDS